MTSLQLASWPTSPQDAEEAGLPADKLRPRSKLVNRTPTTGMRCGTVNALDELSDYVAEWHEDARAGLLEPFFPADCNP